MFPRLLFLCFILILTELDIVASLLLKSTEPPCFVGAQGCPSCISVPRDNAPTRCSNIAGRPQRCYCRTDLCKTFIQPDGKTVFTLANAPPLVGLANFSCEWKLPYAKSLSPHIVLVDQVAPQPMQPITMSNANVTEIVRTKFVRYLDQSHETTFRTSGLCGSAFRATIYQGFCSLFNGTMPLAPDLELNHTHPVLISTHNPGWSSYRAYAQCIWSIYSWRADAMSLVFYSFDLDQGSQVSVVTNDRVDGRHEYVFTRESLPVPVSAKGEILISFTSGEANNGTGFTADILINRCPIKTLPLYARKGSITDGTPAHLLYPPGLNCSWLLTNELDAETRFHFDYIYLFEGDFVRFYAIQNGAKKLIRMATNAMNSVSFRVNGSVLVEFQARMKTEEEIGLQAFSPYFGFKLNYEVCDRICQQCPIGKYYNFTMRRCLNCSDGMSSFSIGSTQCQFCPDGTLYNHTSLTCHGCALGSIYDGRQCIACPQGHVAMNGTCTKCSNQTYAFNNRCEAIAGINWSLVWYGVVLVLCLAIIVAITGYFAWRKRKLESRAMEEFGFNWEIELQ